MAKDHTHYWIIPTPNGPTSLAACKVCGETRLMANSEAEGNPWGRICFACNGRVSTRSKPISGIFACSKHKSLARQEAEKNA